MHLFTLLCILSLSSVFADSIIIGIAGGSGAGKTTLAQAMQKQLSDKEAAIVYMDNYYCNFPYLSFEERKKINWDDPQSIDIALLKQHIMQLKNNCPIEQPIYNFKASLRSHETSLTKPVKIIIIDGFLLLAFPEIRDLCDLKIFVEVEETERLFRIINRDQTDRGYSLQQTKQKYKNFVQPCYQKYIHNSKYYADLIIPNGLDNEKAFQILLELIKNHS